MKCNILKKMILAGIFTAGFNAASMAQMMGPSIAQVYFPPIPVVPADMVDATTSSISNYSTDNCYLSSISTGIDVVGWGYGTGVGGGSILAVGTHSTLSPSLPFNGVATTYIADAVDIQVGFMDPYIVASYYNVLMNAYIFEYFNWSGPSGTTITSAGSFVLHNLTTGPHERLSMDISQDQQHVAFIFTESGIVYGSGTTLSGTVFASPPGTATCVSCWTGGSTTPYTNADLGINYDVSLGHEVFFGFYNTSLGQTGMFHAPFSWFDGTGIPGTATFIEAYTMPTGANYISLDCPDYYDYGKWAYTFSDGNKIYVRTDTINGGSPSIYTTVLNDGTLTNLPTDISSVANQVPKLVYGPVSNPNEIFVVWASAAVGTYLSPYTESFVGITFYSNGPAAPIALQRDYAVVDNDPGSHYINTNALIALSRRNITPNRFLSYITDNPTAGFELKHKSVAATNVYYRTTGQQSALSGASGAEKITVSPNPYTNELDMRLPESVKGDVCTVVITDLLGRSLKQYQGAEARRFVSKASSELPAGQYMLKVQATQAEPSIFKIVKQ